MNVFYLKHAWRGFWSGMLFLEGKSGCILADTATADAPDATLEPFLRERGLSWKSIRLVLNTHSHDDHTDGNILVRERTHAPFAAAESLAGLFEKQGIDESFTLRDGMEIRLGEIRLAVLHTPGHSEDSFCFLERSTGTLFSGDAAQGLGSENIGVPLYVDPEKYRLSLVRLLNLCRSGEIRRIVCSHPERPFQGDVSGAEAERFLETGIRTCDLCSHVTEEYLAVEPNGSAGGLRNRMLAACGASPEPEWPELSFITAEAHLRSAMKKREGMDK